MNLYVFPLERNDICETMVYFVFNASQRTIKYDKLVDYTPSLYNDIIHYAHNANRGFTLLHGKMIGDCIGVAIYVVSLRA